MDPSTDLVNQWSSSLMCAHSYIFHPYSEMSLFGHYFKSTAASCKKILFSILPGLFCATHSKVITSEVRGLREKESEAKKQAFRKGFGQEQGSPILATPRLTDLNSQNSPASFAG
uniref:Uncharacterized protein n=1 Tax=Micrurus surinamensis TaxID=129470 RepID=A0A2D4PBC1_MICSU